MTVDLESLTKEELLNLVEENRELKYTKEKRLEFIELIYKALGYELSNDIRLALLTETDRLLILALAGGGKTTTSLIKLILWQLFNKNVSSQRFLVLVYNRANVDDVKETHRNLVNTINQKLGTHLDSNISVYTIHELSRNWLNKYNGRVGIVGYSSVKGNEDVTYMKDVLERWMKKQIPKDATTNQLILHDKRVEDLKAKAKDIVALYELSIEAMYDSEQISHLESFQKLKISIEDYNKIIKDYEKYLRRRKMVYTYAQGLRMFRDLVRDNKDVRDNMSIVYEKIIVDEVQDVSPIMLDVLKYILPKEKQIMAIGDDDQCIYGYRGSSPKSILNFKEHYKGMDSVILQLNLNRRCPKNIVELGQKVLELNEDRRFHKLMRSTGREGKIDLVPYNSELSEKVLVVNKLRELIESGERSIVVAYRNNSSSEILIDLLKDTKIPFYAEGSNCTQPFEYYLYKGMFDILNMLRNPDFPQYQIDLWKVTPLRKQEIYGLLNYNVKNNSFDGRTYSLDTLPVANISKNRKVLEVFSDIVRLSKLVATEPIKNYANEILSLLDKYYYFPNKSVNHEYFLNAVSKYFNSNLTYDEFLKNHRNQLEFLGFNRKLKQGVRFSTFHALKGLEYNEVVLIDLDDEIFPNDALTDTLPIPLEDRMAIYDENNRLFYVAITRTKNNLTLFYNKDNPSRYIDLVIKFKNSYVVNDLSWFEDLDIDYLHLNFISSYENKETWLNENREEDNKVLVEEPSEKIESSISNFSEKSFDKPVTRRWNRTKLADRLRYI